MAEATGPASEFASAFIRRLAARGVRHIVVSPGSRSQALALAAARAHADGLIRIHVRIDERSAGFLALGLSRSARTPVAIVTTSGTAVANLHPAMLEAWHSGDPLIAVTADRPASLRGRGANQTTTQPEIFGPAATWQLDVVPPTGADDELEIARRVADDAVTAAMIGAIRPSPVHVNLQFTEPLSGPVTPLPDDAAPFDISASFGPPLRVERGLRTVVIAGTGAGPVAEQFARSAGWPLLAEVTSSARFGPNLVRAYRQVLSGSGLADEVERVVVFGRPNLSREVPALLARPGIETILVRSSGAEQFDPTGSAIQVDAAEAPEAPDDSAVAAREKDWLDAWYFTGRQLAEDDDEPAWIGGSGVSTAAERSRLVRAELSAVRSAVSRRALVDAVWRATWPHDRLWFAASRLVRVADAAVPGKKIAVQASRGLAGIDGTISSAFGFALAAADDPRGAAGTTRVLLGDLAFLHDVGGLLLPPGESRPRIQLVVGNDGGGSIFDGLEVAADADPDAFDRVMYTPHSVDIEGIAGAYGWEFTRAATRGDLDRALTAPAMGPSVVEVPLDR
ncbi:2-succinyl-5-enolpyruvyl-6-hydroxy-3-cyclohexene-1-carboxylic-acid synthase [Amnibacterium flavum]|uniref:2-succinyl-5-enolpyruvyl-6-hydroxy-3-cyclohexene-1-carboxylate synthase n=1 Tax=Amnibacterium flavum TaxID=2173173 RepID=A0A2V1HYK8_9MICO|nr:2-succinyl-5-enolpyruvyl-6-hydroxy-3-cyclohexene-1-carboxylic-acid synthase [Amnibacterium flavum]PVZ95604.1 2-succinyl-5-enolpyruvyl-6-hydroxy-3-cyclohexene-1-carboxylic-acid synthase [Amnibacterium flavum]